MDYLVGLDGTKVVLKPLSLEGPSSQKITDLECEKLKALKSDSEIQVDVLESASFTTECEDDKLSKGRELFAPTSSLDNEAVETSSASDQTEDSEMLSASKTPRGNLFDPFAPGSKEKVLAPNPKKKIMWETKISLRRRLVFDLTSDSEEETKPTLLDKEDSLLESICQSFLELIVLNQVKEISNEYLTEEDNSSDVTEEDISSEGTKEDNSSEGTKEDDSAVGWKTPTSLPLLTGIADTCPSAPARPVLKLRRLDHTICRKLEFGSNMI